MVTEMNDLPLERWLIPDTIANCIVLQIFTASNASITGELAVAFANLKLLIIL